MTRQTFDLWISVRSSNEWVVHNNSPQSSATGRTSGQRMEKQSVATNSNSSSLSSHNPTTLAENGGKLRCHRSLHPPAPAPPPASSFLWYDPAIFFFYFIFLFCNMVNDCTCSLQKSLLETIMFSLHVLVCSGNSYLQYGRVLFLLSIEWSIAPVAMI